eukprot:CAMPEP_0205943990 /NCGR_PEP_ID=MMETSP1325-20131115/61959_1 /ASSEMBLY_ACC=CAM_ASM_000708 /TAXON_ID=236786 /ORGANISM="Florenciella sp., Strain RCC1007" /LENGTH=59 /DNA_ID=CAMNT_0053314845 /DNA_START=1 /DNA_END=180 /DNA_ORIENTATION=-
MREVVAAVLDGTDGEKLSDDASKLAVFLDDRVCVPRDVGYVPVQGLRVLARAAAPELSA